MSSSADVVVDPESSKGSAGDFGEVVLEVTDLYAGYGDLAAVRGVSFSVRRSEILALLGANGAGKSTTLMTVAGELPLMGGSVRYLGNPLTGPVHQRVKRGLGFVPGERSVLMGLSVMDNLKLGGNVDRVLELFPELSKLLRRRAGLLSGGEQQMLSVGRALAAQPALLLIDELSLGLAPLVVDRLLAAVARAAREQGTAVVLVEQQVQRAIDVADRWTLMRRGVIAASGDTSDPSELWDNYVS